MAEGTLKIGRIPMGSFSTNAYFVYREGNPDTLVFDAPDHGKELCDVLEKHGLHVRALFLTHGHFDHVWGASELRIAAGAKAEERGEEPVKIYALDAEEALLNDPHLNVSEQMGRPVRVKANVFLTDGQELEISGMKLKVIATPGHTQGGACYYFEEAGILVAGDTLFQESVGRTDLPTGSSSRLVRSIQEKLFCLPDETVVYPGHGDETTIGHEKKYNPFVV